MAIVIGTLRITFKPGELTSGVFRLQERDESGPECFFDLLFIGSSVKDQDHARRDESHPHDSGRGAAVLLTRDSFICEALVPLRNAHMLVA